MRRWFIWGVATLFFFFLYFARSAPGAIPLQLADHFNVYPSSIIYYSTTFSFFYVLGQIPAGVFLDRYGVRLPLSVAILLTSFTIIFFPLMNNYYAGMFFRGLFGICSSFGFVTALKIASIYFPREKFNMLTGITQSIGLIGAAVGVNSAIYFSRTFGWNIFFYVIGFVILLLSGIFFIIARVDDVFLHKSSAKPTIADMKSVIFNHLTWMPSIFIGMVFMPVILLIEAFGVPILNAVQNLQDNQSGILISCILLGWGIGGPIFGYIGQNVGLKNIMYNVSITTGLFFGLLLFVPMHFYLCVLVCCLLGFMNSGMIVGYTMASQIHPENVSGIAIAIANLSTILVGVIGISLMTSYLPQVVLLSANDYRSCFGPILLGPVVGFIVSIYSFEPSVNK